VGWSYDLLTENERVFVDRLSVFAGGFDLAAAEAICGADPLYPEDVIDLLASLVEKSLVMVEQNDVQTRYRLLETICDFARERLIKRDDVAATAARHCEYFLGFAKIARDKLNGAEQAEWTRRLEVELDNLRAAIALSLSGSTDSATAVKLQVALMRFWMLRGYSSEGRNNIRAALQLKDLPTIARAHALYVAGALAINQTCGVKVIGIPGTIDNDIPGTQYSVGFDTAINTALDAIDKIRDTSASHERVFVVEVMGRHNGFIALEVGIAGGAEAVLVPECKTDMIGLCQRIQAGQARGKLSSIIIVAEGAARGADVAATITQITGIETRLSILGHIQRGGSPSARDRSLATRFGYHAVELLAAGKTNLMVGIEKSQVIHTPLDLVTEGRRDLDTEVLTIVEVMST